MLGPSYNHTMESPGTFFLLGIPGFQSSYLWLAISLSTMYSIAVLGNMLIIIVICMDSTLQEPMYFFLCVLAAVDIVMASSVVPKMVSIFSSGDSSISFNACFTQMYFVHAATAVETGLLLAMAFDRYVAICNPLRYSIIMSKEVYVFMASASWFSGSINSVVQTSLAMRLPFCGNNVINHFTCEVLAVLKLACADISLNIITMVISNMAFLVLPLLVIFFSYLFILHTILRMNSATGRRKAFSTCSAHLTVVIIFYGTIFSMYAKPKSQDLTGQDKFQTSDKIISLFYGVVTPMLNPIIYSLRNKDVKAAVKYILKQKYVP